MSELHRNLIGGEWVGGDAIPNINPSDTNDVVGDYARATKADARSRHRSRQGGVSGMVALRPAGAPCGAAQGLRRDHGAQGRARPAAVARRGQDAGRGHRRDGARSADLRLLRRRGAAARRRDGAERAPRRRRRNDARGGRRRRHHHAVEFPDRHSRLEDRAGALPRQHGGVQAGRPGARLLLGDRRHTAPRRPAEGRAQPGHGQGLGGRPGDPRQRRRQRHQLHRLGRHGQARRRRLGRAHAQVPARDGRQEPAGRARRRRPRRRRRLRRQRRLLLDRPALHGFVAADRAERHPRQIRRRPSPRSCRTSSSTMR